MTQKWNVSGYPKPDTSTLGGAHLLDLDDGVETALTSFYGATDPNPGTWGSAELGYEWIDVGVDGSVLNPVRKRWEQVSGTPTYGWRKLFIKHIKWHTAGIALAINGNKTIDVTWTDIDLSTALVAAQELSGYKNILAVILRVSVDADPDAGSFGADDFYIAFRRKGDTDANVIQKVYAPPLANRKDERTIVVPLDSSEVCQYMVEIGGSGSPSMNVAAYAIGIYEGV